MLGSCLKGMGSRNPVSGSGNCGTSGGDDAADIGDDESTARSCGCPSIADSVDAPDQ